MSRRFRALAFDLGASGGRAILGEFGEGGLGLKEVYRFENRPVFSDGHLRWDFSALLKEIGRGLSAAGAFDSVGFDTWGVDFGLLGEGGLLEDPVCYRDSRTEGMRESALQRISAEELYRRTGNQIMPINTLFQLLALKRERPDLLKRAQKLLFLPDLIAHALCGSALCERSIASTSQLLDPVRGDWDRELFEMFGLPERFPPVCPSGTEAGELRLPFGRAKVIAAAGHDTQCAVAAAPLAEDAAFLSCGTWSLIGTELDSPVLSEESMRLELSNELGVGGKVNYLKNIIGLWILQECRRSWEEKGQALSFPQIAALAEEAPPLLRFIDPNAPEFVPPGDMPERISQFCVRTGQTPPQTVGDTARCVYESLAFSYRFALGQIEAITRKKFSALHILGGGANAELLCRMTADVCGIPVLAGPVEATALGNLLVQLLSAGEIADLKEGRELVMRTQPVKRYEPRRSGALEAGYRRFVELFYNGR